MPQTLVEMAKELVVEQIRIHRLPPDDVQALLLSTHATLLSMYDMETSPATMRSAGAGERAEPDWQRSITKHDITCLECGHTFRQLSSRHLRVHDLDAGAYRAKYGIPKTQPLSSHRATARRRELARQIRPWEQATLKRTRIKASAKTPRKRRSVS